MRRALACLLALLLAAAAGLAMAAETPAAAPVVRLDIDGAIGPATADHVRRGLAYAAGQRAQLVVLRLDTPGGLDVSMRAIVKDILASPVPVAAYVAPDGARAASAGTYIVYASHVAAMAPASNLGAATPVAVGLAGGDEKPAATPASQPAGASGDTMGAKRVADAAAYLRSLAQLRGRNAEWGEKAVRESVSLAAHDALAARVVDLVAADLPELLRRLDGRTLDKLADGRSVRLATRDAPVLAFEPDWRSRLLSVIADPSLALMLMMAGLYGLLFEFMNPGYVLPGVVGGICLLLGLFALQMLPFSYAGLALIALGIAFLVGEAFLPSGVLGVGGVAALAFGFVLLFDELPPGIEGIPAALAATLTLVSAAFVLVVGGMAARARRRPVVSGLRALVGATGQVIELDGETAWAQVGGELWKVQGRALRPGEPVRVERVLGGNTLEVAPLEG